MFGWKSGWLHRAARRHAGQATDCHAPSSVQGGEAVTRLRTGWRKLLTPSARSFLLCSHRTRSVKNNTRSWVAVGAAVGAAV